MPPRTDMFHLITKISSSIEVSTVDLRQSLSSPEGQIFRMLDRIILDRLNRLDSDKHFETIVFKNGHAVEVIRYGTEGEARQGHELTVAKWQSSTGFRN